MFKLLQSWLIGPRAQTAVVAIATMLSLPALFTGLLGDDFVHAHILTGSRELAAYRLPWWRLFQFAAPSTNRALFDDGILPWWAYDNLQMSFFRPLTALTHWVDYLLWPSSPFLMHAHSLAWAAVALIAIGALYNLLLSPRWVAALALALYAFESARGITVAWIANRNALIASAFSIWAVVYYLRGQRGSRFSRWASPALFGLGMLAGEGAIGGGAYLVAGALFLERDRFKKRVISLLPHFAVGGACVVVARLTGYGVLGSGEYLDPINDANGYLHVLAERSLIGLFSAVGGPRAEWWNGYELIIPGLSTIVVIGAIVTLAYCAWLLKPLIWRSPVARFWLAGTLLSLLPAAATFPNGRILTWISIGVMGLFAEYLAAYSAGQERRGVAAAAGAYAIVFIHLVFSPLALPGQCWTVAGVRALLERADRAVPTSPEIKNRTVIYVNPPQDTFAVYSPVMRAVHGIARPRTQRWLATVMTEIAVRRIDERTLDVQPNAGFLREKNEQLLRGRQHDFEVNDRVFLSGLTVEIRALTGDGRPARARFVFDHPLEAREYLWLVWRDDGYVPFTPPAIGASVTIPALDFVSVLFGSRGTLSRLFASIRRRLS